MVKQIVFSSGQCKVMKSCSFNQLFLYIKLHLLEYQHLRMRKSLCKIHLQRLFLYLFLDTYSFIKIQFPYLSAA